MSEIHCSVVAGGEFYHVLGLHVKCIKYRLEMQKMDVGRPLLIYLHVCLSELHCTKVLRLVDCRIHFLFFRWWIDLPTCIDYLFRSLKHASVKWLWQGLTNEWLNRTKHGHVKTFLRTANDVINEECPESLNKTQNDGNVHAHRLPKLDGWRGRSKTTTWLKNSSETIPSIVLISEHFLFGCHKELWPSKKWTKL